MIDHPTDQIQRVRVVNRNNFAIHDRFDGVPVVLRPNESMDLAPEVANHVLGYPGDPEDMHRYMAKRWGWNLPKHMIEDDKGDPLWVQQARKIEISTERFELRRITDPNAPIPADQGDGTMLEPPPIPRRQASSEEMHERMAKVRAGRKYNTVKRRAQPVQSEQPVQPVAPVSIDGA